MILFIFEFRNCDILLQLIFERVLSCLKSRTVHIRFIAACLLSCCVSHIHLRLLYCRISVITADVFITLFTSVVISDVTYIIHMTSDIISLKYVTSYAC